MSPINKEKFGLILILLFALASIIGLASQRPISQDVTYHHFGDARTLFAIQNFWNVLCCISIKSGRLYAYVKIRTFGTV